MKSNIIQKLQEIYTPVKPHNDFVYSQAQTKSAWNYVADSVQTLLSLCKKVVLNVRQILITACEIVEMFRRIPSATSNNKNVDMSDMLCSNIKKLAAFMDAYDVDPNNVSARMIRKECDELAANC